MLEMSIRLQIGNAKLVTEESRFHERNPGQNIKRCEQSPNRWYLNHKTDDSTREVSEEVQRLNPLALH